MRRDLPPFDGRAGRRATVASPHSERHRGRSFGIAAIALGVVLFAIAAHMMFGALLVTSLE